MQSVQDYLRNQQQFRDKSKLMKSYSPYFQPQQSPEFQKPSHSPGYLRSNTLQSDIHRNSKLNSSIFEDITNVASEMHIKDIKSTQYSAKPLSQSKTSIRWDRESDFGKLMEQEPVYNRRIPQIGKYTNRSAICLDSKPKFIDKVYVEKVLNKVDNAERQQKQFLKQGEHILNLQNEMNEISKYALQSKAPSYVTALLLKAVVK